MKSQNHYKELIEGITKQYSDIFKDSKQGVYIYLDDTHKVCNVKFAELLGYSSPEEWGKINTSFPQTFVEDNSQTSLVDAFQEALEDYTGSVNNVTWKKKDGSLVNTQVILVPIEFDSHIFALHFVFLNNYVH